METLYEIFLDTNMLSSGAQIGLNERTLRDVSILSKDLGNTVTFTITEQIVEDIIAQFKRAVQSQVDKYKTSSAWLANHFKIADNPAPEIDAATIEKYVRTELKKVGIKVVNIKLNKLDLPAIMTSILRKEGMLGESDRGAKDMVIAAAINEAKMAGSQTFVVTNDDKFRAYLKDKFAISGFENLEIAGSEMRLTLKEHNASRREKLTELASEYWAQIQDTIANKVRTDYKRRYPPQKASITLAEARYAGGILDLVSVDGHQPDPTAYNWIARGENEPVLGGPNYEGEQDGRYEWSTTILVVATYEGTSKTLQNWGQGITANHVVKYSVKFSFKVNREAEQITDAAEPTVELTSDNRVSYSTIYRANTTFVSGINNPGLVDLSVPNIVSGGIVNLSPTSNLLAVNLATGASPTLMSSGPIDSLISSNESITPSDNIIPTKSIPLDDFTGLSGTSSSISDAPFDKPKLK